MTRLTKPAAREIIEDFEKEIEQRKRSGPKPKRTVIDFRNDRKHGTERDIWEVPIELLRYRKDNGRIASDVLNYEKLNGVLDEKSANAQKLIRKFLEDKDKDKTKELKRSIIHDGQRDPAIITCDGFLINGNRRKMVLETLSEAPKHRGENRFSTMKVVILPGKNDEGGPPTQLEIEQIENRYQLMSDGKAEYYSFDRALSMRRKIKYGMSLEEQLRDDPIYAGLNEKDFKKAVKKFNEEYIMPLECIDRYLNYLNRQGLYGSISTGLGDPEGRWQAFYDYYHRVYKVISDNTKRIKHSIKENEVGKIEDAAFKIIRQRELKGLPKVHSIMRDMGKWIISSNSKEIKEELFRLNDIELGLPREDCLDREGNELDPRVIDKLWANKNATDIIRQIRKSKSIFEHKKIREKPIDLLESSLRKLTHEDMDTSSINYSDMKKAMKLTKEIQECAHELESEIYYHLKNMKKLPNKLGK